MSKRIFISFAIEDSNLRDLLVGQARNSNSPFSFIDMSVKKPWDSAWKTNCRTKIKGCDGMIVIVTANSKTADGQLWEVKCAKEEFVPRRGIWGHNGQKISYLPTELSSLQIVEWNWTNLSYWIGTL